MEFPASRLLNSGEEASLRCWGTGSRIGAVTCSRMARASWITRSFRYRNTVARTHGTLSRRRGRQAAISRP